MCIPLGLSIALLRLGEQFTDLGVGKAVKEGALTAAMPWLFLQSRMGVAVEYRLNVWAYEAVAGVLIFIATLAASRWLSRQECSRQGDTALFFMALLGASQILLESLRDDGHMLVIFLRVGQLAAALMTVITCAVLSMRYARLGGGRVRLWLDWAVMLLCVAGIVLLEFSLDGRLSWGEPSMGRDYALMAVLCTAMFAGARLAAAQGVRRLMRAPGVREGPVYDQRMDPGNAHWRPDPDGGSGRTDGRSVWPGCTRGCAAYGNTAHPAGVCTAGGILPRRTKGVRPAPWTRVARRFKGVAGGRCWKSPTGRRAPMPSRHRPWAVRARIAPWEWPIT